MRTLGIIGGGIVGKSLLFSLASQNRQKYDRVILFDADSFAPACSLRTTGIVAARGVRLDVTNLGNMIHDGINQFHEHVRLDRPSGVYPILQVSTAINKPGQFHRRFKTYITQNHFEDIQFSQELPINSEEAFYIEPNQYLSWLTEYSRSKINLELSTDFVTNVSDKLEITTLEGNRFKVDHLILAGNVYNKWCQNLVKEKDFGASKTLKGSFIIARNVDWGSKSYSVTIDEKNLIYRAESKELLIGTHPEESSIFNVDEKNNLFEMYEFLKLHVLCSFPSFESFQVQTGLREKAAKREPYVGTEGNVSYIGGLYKNGFTLSLKMARSLVDQLP